MSLVAWFASLVCAADASVAKEGENELQRLANVCDKLELVAAAEVSRSWRLPQRSDQTNLFLPVAKTLQALEVPATPAATKWLEHFNAYRESQANKLYQRATAVVALNEPQAYRLLWQCLREDPEHEAARTVLGTLAKSIDARPRIRQGAGAQPQLNWAPRSYHLASTPHFSILSKAGQGETLRFARQLEEYYALWTQVFAPVWLQEGKLAGAIQSGRPFVGRRNRFEIVLLPDRRSYLEMLAQAEDNAGVSVGYYSPSGKKSLFYLDEDLRDTLYHELTHQILAEGCGFRNAAEAGTQDSYWLIEGIAIYMESLRRETSYWTVGGWESPRLQTARYRGVRDGYWPPMEEVAMSSIDKWKVDEDIAVLYSHSAGLTHAMMDGRVSLNSRDEILAAIRSVYSQEGGTSALLHSLGSTNESAMRRYQEIMTIGDEDVAQLPPHIRPLELVLCGSELSDESWAVIADRASAANWIDCAFSNIQSKHVKRFASSARLLRRLSLEGTAVTADCILAASELPILEELDLSDCPVTDEMLASLKGNFQLKTLWLTRTGVTSAVLPLLRSMPNLNRCDLSGTKISPADQDGWK